MRGYKEYNFPAFRVAAARLRELGYEVWSPAERDEQEGFDPKTDEAKSTAYYMAYDLKAVCESDAVAVLPGWRESTGAKLEVHVAQVCEIPVLDAETLAPIDETILQEAQRIVDGSRQSDYGHPADDFARTAAMWAAIFDHPFTAEDVPLAMICIKLSRLRQSPRHRDSVTDVAGYARTLEKVWERDLAR
jgi:hypothetical protein